MLNETVKSIAKMISLASKSGERDCKIIADHLVNEYDLKQIAETAIIIEKSNREPTMEFLPRELLVYSKKGAENIFPFIVKRKEKAVIFSIMEEAQKLEEKKLGKSDKLFLYGMLNMFLFDSSKPLKIADEEASAIAKRALFNYAKNIDDETSSAEEVFFYIIASKILQEAPLSAKDIEIIERSVFSKKERTSIRSFETIVDHLMKNKNLSEDAFWLLYSKYKNRISRLGYLASNPSLPEEILQTLKRKSSKPSILGGLIANPKVETDFKVYNIDIALSSNITKKYYSEKHEESEKVVERAIEMYLDHIQTGEGKRIYDERIFNYMASPGFKKMDEEKKVEILKKIGETGVCVFALECLEKAVCSETLISVQTAKKAMEKVLKGKDKGVRSHYSYEYGRSIAELFATKGVVYKEFPDLQSIKTFFLLNIEKLNETDIKLLGLDTPEKVFNEFFNTSGEMPGMIEIKIKANLFKSFKIFKYIDINQQPILEAFMWFFDMKETRKKEMMNNIYSRETLKDVLMKLAINKNTGDEILQKTAETANIFKWKEIAKTAEKMLKK